MRFLQGQVIGIIIPARIISVASEQFQAGDDGEILLQETKPGILWPSPFCHLTLKQAHDIVRHPFSGFGALGFP